MKMLMQGVRTSAAFPKKPETVAIDNVVYDPHRTIDFVDSVMEGRLRRKLQRTSPISANSKQIFPKTDKQANHNQLQSFLKVLRQEESIRQSKIHCLSDKL